MAQLWGPRMGGFEHKQLGGTNERVVDVSPVLRPFFNYFMSELLANPQERRAETLAEGIRQLAQVKEPWRLTPEKQKQLVEQATLYKPSWVQRTFRGQKEEFLPSPLPELEGGRYFEDPAISEINEIKRKLEAVGVPSEQVPELVRQSIVGKPPNESEKSRAGKAWVKFKELQTQNPGWSSKQVLSQLSPEEQMFVGDLLRTQYRDERTERFHKESLASQERNTARIIGNTEYGRQESERKETKRDREKQAEDYNKEVRGLITDEEKLRTDIGSGYGKFLAAVRKETLVHNKEVKENPELTDEQKQFQMYSPNNPNPNMLPFSDWLNSDYAVEYHGRIGDVTRKRGELGVVNNQGTYDFLLPPPKRPETTYSRDEVGPEPKVQNKRDVLRGFFERAHGKITGE